MAVGMAFNMGDILDFKSGELPTLKWAGHMECLQNRKPPTWEIVFIENNDENDLGRTSK